MRVSKMTVYRLVHGGELPAARVGRSFRVPRRAVEDHLRNACFDAGSVPTFRKQWATPRGTNTNVPAGGSR